MGISKLIELDLLRHGTWAASFGPKSAFAIIEKSAEALAFVDEKVYPIKEGAGIMLTLFAEGRLLMEPGYRYGNPELIFFSADTTAEAEN